MVWCGADDWGLAGGHGRCGVAERGRRLREGAARVEMVHNLSLLYDDVLDGDTVRRHRAAAWQVLGPSSAARSTDATMLTAFDVLSEADRTDGQGAVRTGTAGCDWAGR
ncbi:polyprenyl synthetase family protein [Streptomyces ortus]|uniref:Polyprenyl synthetase family protein n=1 Tax=Streptomyces ortus TaxID=2867268 RepID=A0ABT3UVI6_9ACTN|nr:polyprenyl synthetase family protein [Streptomyces ortus]MCX4231587.1 polyprenyl synthetase family protein [Streptomyces ortus]